MTAPTAQDVVLYAQIASGPAYAQSATACQAAFLAMKSAWTYQQYFPADSPACLAGRSRELVIGYCGTRSGSVGAAALDLKIDFNQLDLPFEQSILDNGSYPGALVVPGFLGRFAQSKDAVTDSLTAAFAGSTPPTLVTVVGHSLGGALATYLALVALKLPQAPPIQLITFGAPPCLSSDLADALQDAIDADELTVLRYANIGDPITWVSGYLWWQHPPGGAQVLENVAQNYGDQSYTALACTFGERLLTFLLPGSIRLGTWAYDGLYAHMMASGYTPLLQRRVSTPTVPATFAVCQVK